MNGLLNCYSSSESEDSDLYKSSESEEEDQVNQQINKKKAKSGIVCVNMDTRNHVIVWTSEDSQKGREEGRIRCDQSSVEPFRPW